MKEKIMIALMFIAIAIYFTVGIYQCHKQVQEGILVEEQIREDQIIW